MHNSWQEVFQTREFHRQFIGIFLSPCNIGSFSFDFIADKIVDYCLEESWFVLVLLFSSSDLCLRRGDFELFMLLEMDHHGKDIVSTSKFYFGDRHVRKCKNVINIVTGLVQVFGCSWWWWWCYDLCRWLWTLKPLHQPSKACLSLEIESFGRRRKHIWLSITGIWLGIIDCTNKIQEMYLKQFFPKVFGKELK